MEIGEGGEETRCIEVQPRNIYDASTYLVSLQREIHVVEISFGPYSADFSRNARMSANIAYSTKVVAFCSDGDSPLLSRRGVSGFENERVRSVVGLVLVTPSSHSKWDPPKTRRSRGNYRQLFVHRAASQPASQPFGVYPPN